MRKLNTHDVFALARLINATKIKETFRSELEEIANGNRFVLDPQKDGMTLVFALMSAMAEAGAEQAFYDFVSAPFEMTPKEVEELPPEKTLEMLGQLADIEEWKSFFRRAAAFSKIKMEKQ